ncbi:hypothetical protein RRG08_029941 [Elysia crispata]|uniref:Uncharacterized protein n=1 Tax=Elysia crispata TaxID=231223 RepID=A0AAE0ZJW9_9GAST|nr:hypothetical protein RRG08_029941 [Elysia crispata]
MERSVDRGAAVQARHYCQTGGPNTIGINEAMFSKRKYSRGRVVGGQWVLGSICRVTRECFSVAVADRTANILVSIIQELGASATIIYTDVKIVLPIE